VAAGASLPVEIIKENEPRRRLMTATGKPLKRELR